MNTQNSTITKLAETALMAALCYVSFTFLQIKIPVPGGDATSIHIGNAFCVLAALLSAVYMAVCPVPSEWNRRPDGPGLYYWCAENICPEVLYRP